MPSSMPAGMLTDSERSSVTRPWPAHFVQGSLIVWPRPWQVGQVRSIEKKPWRGAHAASAVAGGAGRRLGAGLGAGARAVVAGDRGRHADLRGLAGKGLLERDLHVVAQVGAAPRGRRTSARWRAAIMSPKISSKMSAKPPAPSEATAAAGPGRPARRRRGRSGHRRRASADPSAIS